jgi:hypothetical protein
MRQTFEPYRGYSIEVRVTREQVIASAGTRYYTVSWLIRPENDTAAPIVSFPESADFVSHEIAFHYGENRARAFIDFLLASKRE